VERLRVLQTGDIDHGRWEPMQAPGDEALLARVERRVGVSLPEDLRSVLLAFGGGTLTGPGDSVLIVGPIGDLATLNPDPMFEERLPGMFIIGNDGGGDLYFCDPEDRLGRGRCAIFMVPMGEARLSSSRFAAATFTQACDAVLQGVDFFARPPIGTSPPE
jgi:hypothetical protein